MQQVPLTVPQFAAHSDFRAMSRRRLLGMGATSQWPPRDFGAGYVGASVVDPFGNVLGVMQRPLG